MANQSSEEFRERFSKKAEGDNERGEKKGGKKEEHQEALRKARKAKQLRKKD